MPMRSKKKNSRYNTNPFACYQGMKLQFTTSSSPPRMIDKYHGIAVGEHAFLSHPEFNVLLKHKNMIRGERYPSRVGQHMETCYLNIYARFCIAGNMYFMDTPASKQISFIREDVVVGVESQDKYVSMPICEEYKPIYDFFLKAFGTNGDTVIKPKPKQGDLIYIDDHLNLANLKKVIEDTKNGFGINEFCFEDTLDTLDSMIDWVVAPNDIKDEDIKKALVVVFDTTVSNDHFR